MLVYVSVAMFYFVNGILCILGKGYIQKDYRNQNFTEEYRKSHGKTYLMISIPVLIFCFVCLVKRINVLSLWVILLALPGLVYSANNDMKYLKMTDKS